MESEKNKIISDLENKIAQLQGTLNDTTKNKTQLEEHKLKLEINQKIWKANLLYLVKS